MYLWHEMNSGLRSTKCSMNSEQPDNIYSWNNYFRLQLHKPLDCHVWNRTCRKKMLLICFLMKARKPRNLPYILWRTVLRKSRSRGSSLSNSSNNYNSKHKHSKMYLPYVYHFYYLLILLNWLNILYKSPNVLGLLWVRLLKSECSSWCPTNRVLGQST